MIATPEEMMERWEIWLRQAIDHTMGVLALTGVGIGETVNNLNTCLENI
jgi:hypothetical protein